MTHVDLTLDPVEAQIVVEALANIGGLGPQREAATRVRVRLLDAGFDYTDARSPDYPFEEGSILQLKNRGRAR